MRKPIALQIEVLLFDLGGVLLDFTGQRNGLVALLDFDLYGVVDVRKLIIRVLNIKN